MNNISVKPRSYNGPPVGYSVSSDTLLGTFKRECKTVTTEMPHPDREIGMVAGEFDVMDVDERYVDALVKALKNDGAHCIIRYQAKDVIDDEEKTWYGFCTSLSDISNPLVPDENLDSIKRNEIALMRVFDKMSYQVVAWGDSMAKPVQSQPSSMTVVPAA